jgi:hypothetical protein
VKGLKSVLLESTERGREGGRAPVAAWFCLASRWEQGGVRVSWQLFTVVVNVYTSLKLGGLCVYMSSFMYYMITIFNVDRVYVAVLVLIPYHTILAWCFAVHTTQHSAPRSYVKTLQEGPCKEGLCKRLASGQSYSPTQSSQTID